MSHRRDFLKTTAGLAATATVPYIFTSGRVRADGPNDRLSVASIGVGGRGSGIGHQAGSKGNMVACCDVDREHAEEFASRYNGRCDIYGDYRQVLDRDDVEVVTIGTPDHWHVKIATEALLAGKDVYCEKPLTLTIDEGKTICRVVKETGRVMQVGTQQRSEFNNMFLKAVVLAQSGRLGENLTARCQAGAGQAGGPFAVSDPPPTLNWDMWLGQTPEEGYCPERCHFNFRWWLEYSGGQVTDWGVHVADIGLWALGLDKTGPTTIEGSGTFPDVGNGYNAATGFDATMTFENGRKIFLTSADGGDVLLEGELGRIRVSRGRLVGRPIEDLTATDQDWLDEEVIKLYRGKQPGDHMRNFFECVKDRSLPISDVFTHHRSVSVCHLANIAMRLGRKLNWDPAAEDFIGDDEASSMLSREQRAPYTING
jgi:predicted dehydrogenase